MPSLWKSRRAANYLAQFSPAFDYDASVLRGIPDGSRAGLAWDLSGNNRHCYRVGSANVPRVKLNAQNSLPAYNFNSPGQRLFTAVNARVPQDVTAFIICKFNTGVGAAPYLFSWFSSPNCLQFAQSSTGVQLDYRAPNSQELSGGSFAIATATTNYEIYCCAIDSTTKTGTVFKNGASIGSSTNTAMSWSGFAATSQFRLNADLNNGNPGEAFMAKLVIFPSLLSVQNIAAIFAHLNSIWAVY